MSKDEKDIQQTVNNQFAWILNYQPKIENQNINVMNQAEKLKNKSGAKKKKEGEKKDKPKAQKKRETMTFRMSNDVLKGHISMLFSKLSQEKWIAGEEKHFIALFSGKRQKDCELTWLNVYGKGTLVGLFKRLMEEELITLDNGFTLSSVLEGHFKDTDGEWLTGLDKGDKTNNKALPVIQECVELLQTDFVKRLGRAIDDDTYRGLDSTDLNTMRIKKR